MVAELRRCGIEADETEDGFVVRPGAPTPATIETYDDHRMAMSFALLGLRAPGIRIADPGVRGQDLPRLLGRARPAPVRRTCRQPIRVDLPMSHPDENGSTRVIAIDGPAGSGKSTVARAVAARTGLDYLDTGAMYRAVTFAAMRRGVDPSDIDPVVKVARDLDLRMSEDGTVVVDGADATIEIRGPEVTRAVSIVAANPGVRDGDAPAPAGVGRASTAAA